MYWQHLIMNGGIAACTDDAAPREAQSRKDAVRAYEVVYEALGAR